jgi:hypothetical protein
MNYRMLTFDEIVEIGRSYDKNDSYVSYHTGLKIVIEWSNNNIRRYNCWDPVRNGDQVFEFNNEEDAMLFELTWL